MTGDIRTGYSTQLHSVYQTFLPDIVFTKLRSQALCNHITRGLLFDGVGSHVASRKEERKCGG